MRMLLVSDQLLGRDGASSPLDSWRLGRKYGLEICDLIRKPNSDVLWQLDAMFVRNDSLLADYPGRDTARVD